MDQQPNRPLAGDGIEEIWKLNRIVPATASACMHNIIAARAASHPEKTAVHAWDGDFTYAELDTLSSSLANHLIELDIGPQDVVPLFFEKSRWTVVGVVGVLKAGGAFALVDVSQPESRLRAIIEQCRAKVICTSVASEKLLSQMPTKALVVGSDLQHYHLREDLQQPKPDPSWPMYVCFTSGSTGKPKGIVITHESFWSAMQQQAGLLGFSPDSRTFDFASYSFDVAVHNVMTTLAVGGCLCIPSEKQKMESLNETMRDMRANIVNLTASVAQLLRPDMTPDLKTLILLGEAVSQSDLERIWGKLRIINTYGPAECTPISTINVTAKDPETATRIGHGVGVLTWVVDANNDQQLAAVGSIGELLLEGPVQAQGYLHDPTNTAKAFINNPPWLLQGAGEVPGRSGRLYKTGDLVRYNQDGSLSFMGRKDTQVKIRGQRIELGEVEYHVRSLMPSTAKVVAEVIKPEGQSEKATLAVFLADDEDDDVEAWSKVGELSETMTVVRVSSEIEETLSTRLPRAMIPTVYFLLDEIPLSVNAKTDRKRLREMGSRLTTKQLASLQTASAGMKRPPETEAERQLQGLWATILAVSADAIGLDDSFFRLGGDSMSAMKLVSEARKCGLTLSVADIFRQPVLFEQARVVSSATKTDVKMIPEFSLLTTSQSASELREELSTLCGDVDECLIEDAYPCTALQEGMLSLTSKRSDGTGNYIMQAVLELADDVSLDDMKRAWQVTVESTAILRTRIVQHSEAGLVQVVCGEEMEWRRADNLDQYLKQDMSVETGLGDRLFRLALVDSESKKPRWLVVTLHHALFDGWSLPLLMERVHDAYRGVSDIGRNQVNFNAFVEQNLSVSSDDAASYWRSLTNDGDITLFPALPTTMTEPEPKTTLETRLTTTSQLDVTVSTMIRAALALLITQYTGFEDVIFGSVVSGRNTPLAGIESLIGPTIATVPVRINIHKAQTVREFLKTVQQQATEMMAYEQTGLQEIAKLSESARSACNFQTLLVVQPEEDGLQGSNVLGTWQTQYSNQNQQMTQTYALTLECILAGDEIRIQATFDERVVDPWNMNKMLKQFTLLMERLSGALPNQTVEEILTASPEDMAVISQWNKAAPAVVQECVDELIMRNAISRPDSPAINAWDGHLTHGELDALSLKVSNLLRGLGVGPEVVVPLCFEKSMWTIVAILGVLKAGGAFVLLDPGNPEQRLRTICQQVGATVAITSSTYQSRLSNFIDHTVVLDNRILQKSVEPAEKAAVSPRNAAYIIFTSGSTGQPKGCAIEHYSYCSAAVGHGKVMSISSETRSLQFGSYQFAGAIMEILMVLIYGGCVCVLSEEQRGSQQLAKAIHDLDANWAFLTATVLAGLSPNDVPSLKTVCAGGESIRSAQLAEWAPKVQLRQTYGSAETSAVVSSALLSSKKSTTADVGKATTGRYWIVDKNDLNKLVPIGAPGEIIIESPAIAREYVGDSVKSAQAFVSVPSWREAFGAVESGIRFFRTGDLGMYKRDGSIALMGRKDTQVKLRGQRIEVEEIEYQAKLATPIVRSFVVVLGALGSGDFKGAQLVGFFTMDSEIQNGHVENNDQQVFEVIRRVQNRLEGVLPHYMIPTILVPISALPLTASGKTDRRRLREMASQLTDQQLAMSKAALAGDKRPPRTKAELRLRDLWVEVLNVRPADIGLGDSFFRLGGDSVAALKLVGVARRAGLTIAVADIFQNPVLEAQARLEMKAVEDETTIMPFSLISNEADNANLRSELSALCHIDASSVEDAYPCTPLQEGLMSLTAKRSGDYIMQAVLQLAEEVQLDDFRSAWNTAVQATTVFRTRLVQYEDAGLLQVVSKDDNEWDSVDTAELDDYLKQDKSTPMELGSALSRFALVRDAQGQRWFVWTIHHALYDGWSLPRMMTLVNDIYSGRAIRAPTNFNRFIRHVTERRKADDADSYWESSLGDGEFAIFPALPATITEPKADKSIEMRFSLTARSEFTTAAIIRAALAILIGQHTGFEDVVFGAVVSGRNAPIAGIEDVIGPTMATVPVRTRVPKDQDVMAYLNAVQNQAASMIPYEQSGLQQISKVCDGSRNACSFQTLLVVHSEGYELHNDETKLGTWQKDSAQGFTTYALTLEVYLGKDEHKLTASFDSRILDQWTMERILSQLKTTMEYLQNPVPNQTVGSICSQALTAEDKKLLWTWNKDLPATVERCLHGLISEQVVSRPEAQAVCSWDGELTYRELDELSSKLAYHLNDLGVSSKAVGSEMIVPLCFEKTMWTVVAMLGVLKAGGAFILLEPSLPDQRVQNICQQAKARIAITSHSCQNRFSGIVAQSVTLSQELINSISSTPSKTATANPENAAYVIFTSGSTGQPKGCVIEHRSYCSAALNHGSVLGMSKYTRALQFGSYSFAGAIMETLMTLIYGGCVCILSENERGSNLTQAISRLNANWAFLTSTTLAHMNPDDVPSLRTVNIGGEPIRRAQIRHWAPRIHLRQTYGSAETSAVVSSAHLEANSEPTFVGKATTSRYWIVDPTDVNQLMPIGAPGEVIIEGPTIGRRYLGDSVKSAAAFIAQPLWRKSFGPVDATCRFYKTGDMASFRRDGSICLLGRKDNQVKLRGQRIEVEEVEQQARQSSADVAEVAVVLTTLHDHSSETQELVAFIVPQTQHENGATQSVKIAQYDKQTRLMAQNVQTRLQSVLPYYMVPSLIIPMAKLPRTVSGKMDRKRLRDIGSALSVEEIDTLRNGMEGEKRQPTTEKELKLRDLWALVLDVQAETIGIDDSFFRLGGDSIAAMKIVGEARKIGLELAVADLFRQPILHQLASQARHSTESSTILIPRAQITGPVEQSYAQGRLWFMDQLHPGLSWYLMPFAMRIRGPLRLDALESALHALESRHETLRTTFTTRDGVSLQTVLPFQPKPLTIVDVSADSEEVLADIIERDHTTVFDMETEAGWRATIFKVGDNDHVLSIVMHHIISDGWSMDIIRRELAIFYSAAIDGKDPLASIEPLSIQYRDYSIWQKQQEPEHLKQLDYWVEHLETSHPAEIPCDKPRPATLSGLAEVEEIYIKDELYDQLRRFCKQHDVTPFIVLLAAFRAAHYSMTMAVDATIGTPNANRDQWQLNSIIGFFVNPQCMRIKIGEDDSFADMVQRVQKVSTASFENQDVPFERIVSGLHAGRDLSRHPLIQMVFAVHSQPDLGKFMLDGLDVDLIPMPETSRFDVEFHFFQEKNGFKGQLVYSTDLYEPATMQGLLSLFRTALERGLSEPETPVTLLPQCTKDDYTKLEQLGLLQIKRTPYPRDQSIVDVFRTNAKQWPNQIAVKDTYKQLTYEELDKQSEALAQWLTARSFAPESLICVYANRSCDAIIAFLGILKAGLAYVPLDTKTPIARLQHIFDFIPGRRLVILGSNTEFPDLELEDMEFVPIKESLQPASQINHQAQSLQGIVPTPSSLAYVVFTSGSTGKPKGVMVEHRGIVRLAKQDQYTLGGPVSHMLNIAFDASSLEIYLALLNGQTLVCIDSMTVLDYNALADVFSREGIRVSLFTSALFKQLLSEKQNTIGQLDMVLVGGDRLDPQDVFKARQLMNGKIINAYGPTENSCTSTMYTFKDGERCTNGVPIGRTIDNSGAFVMDSALNIVPLGVVGELVVTGDGVARGYINPLQNKNRFTDVSIGGETTRAYRTGDYVRWRPMDGELEFVGRIDGQVKIRGHRIEVAEIEHVLRGHEAVNDSVILLRQQEDRGAELVGFVTLKEATERPEKEATDEGSQGNTSEHMDQWHRIFESGYVEVDEIHGDKVGRDFIGWTSMFDQSKISNAEMNEWLDDTIHAILNGGDAGSVLEIGTGTGHILFNLTKGLRSYHGLEPSETAVDYVNKAVKSIPTLSEKVHVRQGTAADIDRLKSIVAPNVAVINSVAQYFPSRDYLQQVVEDLLQLSGLQTIFFGDMRSHALYREFRAKKALYSVGKNATKDEVLREMEAIERIEPEFLVDPAFFTSLVTRLPDLVEHVEILPKLMKATNELSSYRYAAVVHAKQSGTLAKIHNINTEWIDFKQQSLDRESLLHLLRQSSSSSTVAVSNIPHSKTIVERFMVDALDDQTRNEDTWQSDVHSKAQQAECLSALDLVAVAQEAGYRVEISWARQYSQRGGLDAVFHHYEPLVEGRRTLFQFPTDHQGRMNDLLCSQPLKQRIQDKIPGEVREWLQSQLPAYMIPRTITVLDKMPVNPNGKVDRKALLERAPKITVPQGEKRQPTSQIEHQIQDIWSQVLGVEPDLIGIDDSFFQLGGDSILAMKVVSKAHKIGIKLAIADIFRQPVLSEQAQFATSSSAVVLESPAPFSLLRGENTGEAILQNLASLCGIDVSLVEDSYPCTPLQEGLLSLTTQRSSDYVMQMALELAPGIDVTLLKKAWEEVVASLTILRTRIIQQEDHGLVQVVCKENIHWATADDLNDYVAKDIQTTFGLGCPLSRFALITNGDEKPRHFVWTVHHALYDGWSLPIILDLVRSAYEGRRTLARPNFSSFIRHLIGLKDEDAREYWQRQLGEGDFSTFPTLPGTVKEAAADAEVDFMLPANIEFRKDVTLSTLARGAMGILLSQYSGAADVVFGAVLSGRNAALPGIDDIVGPTLATVPIGVQLQNDQYVSDYLQKVQRQATDMMEFEQTGLQKIAAMDESCRSACGFQTLLVVQPTEDEMDDRDMLGVWSNPSAAGSNALGYSTYGITFQCFLNGQKKKIKANFDPRLVDKWTMQKMLEQFGAILERLTSANTSSRVGEIRTLTQSDVSTVWKWNELVPQPVDRCLHHVIADHAQTQPDAPAICAWDGNATFKELDELSTRLSYRLVELGVGPEIFVPVLFEKSMWAVVAMLGVLKAGGAFVPLDPGSAADRRRLIMEKIGARVVLISASAKGISLPSGCAPLVVSRETLDYLNFSENKISYTKGLPSSAAYIIFTSGSTGEPKGVVMEHRSALTSCMNHGAAFGLGPGSRMLQAASYTFDLAIIEVFTVLTRGACVCVVSDAQRLDDLVGAMNSMAMTTAFLTPTVARTLQRDRIETLKTIILGAEPVSMRDFESWSSVGTVLNGYGPTEAAMISVTGVCTRESMEKGSIGSAVGCASWVADRWDHNQLAPLGAVGELLLEGHILAREYFDAPDKTASAFIENPPWLIQGPYAGGRQGRLYKTGDLVRYNEDGSLSYVGRKDNQVKIRGQRVELGEVEGQLGQHMPFAHQLAAEVIKPSGARPMLACFFSVLDDDGNQVKEHLRRVEQIGDGVAVVQMSPEFEMTLSERLPRYMVPSLYLKLDHIPQTASEKTNRRQLQAIGSALSAQQLAKLQAALAGDKRLPQTDMEHQLRDIWAKVLNIDAETIGIDDSFLHLGGDSITAMQVSAAARAIQADISTADVLRMKTISLLAANAGSLTTGTQFDIDSSDENNDEAFSLSPIQQLYVQVEADPKRCFDQGFFLKLRVSTPVADIRKAIETIVSRHPMLHSRFARTSEGHWTQHISPDIEGSFSLATAEYADPAGSAQAEAIQHCRETLDIENGPLFSAVAFCDPETLVQNLYLSAHHLVIDLISWRVLFQELEEVLQKGETALQPTTSFRTWIKLQSQQMAKSYNNQPAAPPSAVQQPLVSYWGVDSSSNVVGATASINFSLDDATSSVLFGTCNQAFGTRPIELLVAALGYSFQNTFTDRPVPAIFSEGHGREPWDSRIDLSRSVGWFTTIWPAQAGGQNIGSSLVAAICRTKDFMRALPNNGWEYFSSRFATEEAARLHGSSFPLEILFNYIGSFQQLERADAGFEVLEAPEGCEPPSAAGLRRFALFDVGAQMERGRLIVYVSYPKMAQHQEKIAAWVQNYKTVLEQLPTILRDNSPSWTLSDFPSAFTSYSNLAEFQRNVERLPVINNIAEVEDIFPCSPMQEGLLVGQGKDSNNYRTVLTIEILTKEGIIDISRIKEAWRAVVRRHTLLRALVVDDVPGSNRTMLVVLRDPLPGMTVSQKSFAAPNGLTNVDNSQSETYGPQGLQHHLSIHRDSDHRAELQLHINHLLCDGFSIHVLLNDFRKAYHGELGSIGPAYRKYIEYIQEQSHDASFTFWTKHLNGIEPTFFPPSQTERNNETFFLHVPNIDADRIHKFCASQEITTASLIQTAWGLILQAYTGSMNPCFGTMTSGRDAPIEGVNEMMAPLICIIPCFIQFSKRQSVMETMREVQENFVGSLPHQTFPLMEIQRAFNAGAAGLFNSIISFQKGVVQPNEHQEGDVIHYTNGQDQAEYDVSINASDTSTDLALTFLFRHDFMSMTEAKRLVEAFSIAIDALITRPDGDAADISLVSHTDREQIWSWNDHTPHTFEACVHEIVEKQIQQRPDAVAICSGEGELTYKDLDRLSTHLAHHLATLGVGPEVVVPLCFEKSMWTIVAILGVLKAGGAFVLPEPGLPDERMRKICRQVQCFTAISSVACQTRLAAFVSDVTVLGWDFFKSTPFDSSSILTEAKPENAAYIIFTSGSTGEPKGCIIEHRSYCSLVPAQKAMSNMSSEMRTLQFGSYNFAGSIYEILMTLMHGGCICVPSEEERGKQLAKAIQRYNVNWTFITSTVLALLDPDDVPSLKTICVGGEPVRNSQIKQWAGRVTLRQTYGSAETAAVISTGWLESSSATTDVGRPVPARCWIVSPTDHNKLTPIGVPGEIIVEGPSIGRGYLGQPERTVLAFISAPTWRSSFGPCESTSRFYKTGDLAVYKPDGAIQLLGRKDTQIKLRGQRIEVGEIEYQARLATSEIKDVAVELLAIGGDTSKSPELVGFLVMNDTNGQSNTDKEPSSTLFYNQQTCATIEKVQARLESVLPHYMVPAHLVPIPALPLTVTGKTDRLRLRKMGSELSMEELADLRAALAGEKRQPQTDAERRLRDLWAEVLEIDAESIGVNDSFFRRGGDSIAAMRLVGIARKAGMTLAIADIFRNPMLSAQAVALDKAQISEEVSTLVPAPFSLIDGSLRNQVIQSAQGFTPLDNIADALPLTSFQEENISFSVDSPKQCLNYVFLDLGHKIDLDRLATSCNNLLGHFSSLRSIFVSSQGQYWQVILKTLTMSLQSHNAEESLSTASQKVCLDDSEGGFKLGSPPVSFMLVKNETEGSRLIMRLSHAQYDGVSMPIIIKSLLDLYQEKPLDPAVDFSVFLRHCQTKEPESSAYWQRLLQGSCMTQLPTSLDAPSKQLISQGAATRRVEVEGSFDLPTLPENVTMSSVIGSAWGLVMSAITGEDDVIYGSLVAGRNASLPRIDDVVGPCLNIIPVRARLSSDRTSRELFTSIQDQIHFVGEADALGLKKIVESQPSWPSDAKFSSIIQHQNIEERPEFDTAGTSVKVDWFENPDYVPPSLSMISYPGKDCVKIKIMANTHIMAPETASNLINCLGQAVEGLLADDASPLASIVKTNQACTLRKPEQKIEIEGRGRSTWMYIPFVIVLLFLFAYSPL